LTAITGFEAWLLQGSFPDTMLLGGFAMAQREQHERVKKMDRWAGKLLGHKAVVVAMLGVIAMASGLAMANLGGGAGGVSFERTDGSGSLVEPGSGDASSGKTSEGSSTKASAAAEVYVDVDGAATQMRTLLAIGHEIDLALPQLGHAGDHVAHTPHHALAKRLFGNPFFALQQANPGNHVLPLPQIVREF
jgi:hypothetical protein